MSDYCASLREALFECAEGDEGPQKWTAIVSSNGNDVIEWSVAMRHTLMDALDARLHTLRDPAAYLEAWSKVAPSDCQRLFVLPSLRYKRPLGPSDHDNVNAMLTLLFSLEVTCDVTLGTTDGSIIASLLQPYMDLVDLESMMKNPIRRGSIVTLFKSMSSARRLTWLKCLNALAPPTKAAPYIAYVDMLLGSV